MISGQPALRRLLVTVALGLSLPPIATSQTQDPWPTLAKVLADNSVPLPPSSVANAAMTITSFEAINEPSQFAIAFYRDNGNNELKPPLYLLRYDKAAQRWIHNELSGIQTKFTTGMAPGGKPQAVDCLGSASIHSIPGLLLVSTHLSPSASCTMVLTPELKVIKTFSGWMLAAVNSTLVYRRSEIHFAPTHPLRIAAYNLDGGREFDIYPALHDPLRADFQRRLAAVAERGWCRQNNSHCDPQRMSANLGTVAVNEKGGAIAFDVTFESEGFGPKADADIGEEKYFYVFTLTPRIDYRVFDEYDMKPMFGKAAADVLVRPEVLDRIFATRP